jgi:hypothetical protein
MGKITGCVFLRVFLGGLAFVEFYIGNHRVVGERRLGRVIAWMSKDLGNEFQFGT